MPRHVTPDGQVFDGPDHVIAALKTLEDHARDQAATAKMFGPPVTGPSATERHTAIRTAQYEAALAGRTYQTPAAPQVTTVAPDLSTMTPSQRWGAWRDSGSG
jgi:hypothetical protein